MLINELKLVTLDKINEDGNVEVREPEAVFEKH
jgi:threonylcarbamoyladenosine tRNA methylthiotransferase MtaB